MPYTVHIYPVPVAGLEYNIPSSLRVLGVTRSSLRRSAYTTTITMDFYSQRFPPFQTPFFQNLQQQRDAACMDCATECSQPSCPSVVKAITAQCTEQCVLIPCDDPQHASELICIEKETHDHCDMACDQVQDCADCGWDDLVCISPLTLNALF